MPGNEDRKRLLKAFQKYQELASKLGKCAAENGLPDVVRELDSLSLRLLQGPVRLLIVGVSCAGKSTLVNALSGDIVAPEGDWATSCIPLWVRGDSPNNNTLRQGVFQKDNVTEVGIYQYDGTIVPGTDKAMNIGAAFNQMCQVAGQAANVPPNMKAVLTRVHGGFLEESGLTLVDTPGLGQQDGHDAQTAGASSFGAELLLVAHGANAKQDTEFIPSLFPGGERDLGLDMGRDLFLLGNPVGICQREGVKSTLAAMVSQWGGVDIIRQFYWVNLLEQRLLAGYYQYTQWFSGGANMNNLKQMEARERALWEKLKNAQRQAQLQIGQQANRPGDTRSAETEEDDLTFDPEELFFDPEEEESRIIRQRPEKYLTPEQEATIAAFVPSRRIQETRESWADMERLRQDLVRRAEELYREPERICRPIEATLLEATEAVCSALERRKNYELTKIQKWAEVLFRSEFFPIDEKRFPEEVNRFQNLEEQMRKCRDEYRKAEESLEGLDKRLKDAVKTGKKNWEDSFLLKPEYLNVYHFPTDWKYLDDPTIEGKIQVAMVKEYKERRTNANKNIQSILPMEMLRVCQEAIQKCSEEITRGFEDLHLCVKGLPQPDPPGGIDQNDIQREADAAFTDLRASLKNARNVYVSRNEPDSFAGRLVKRMIGGVAPKLGVTDVIMKEMGNRLNNAIGADAERYLEDTGRPYLRGCQNVLSHNFQVIRTAMKIFEERLTDEQNGLKKKWMDEFIRQDIEPMEKTIREFRDDVKSACILGQVTETETITCI